MRRIALLLAGALLTTVGLTACGSSDDTSSSTDGSSTSGLSSPGAVGTTAPAGATSPTAAPSDCPTDNTRAFAKTRFVGDVGLIIGSFHHWIWKPYQAGTFTKGAHGRTFAIIKAGAAALLITKLTSNAVKNVKASPILCTTILGPLNAVAGQLSGLAGKIKSGDLGALTSLNASFASITSLLATAGLSVKETYHK